MNIKVETEMKYYCMEPEKLISIAVRKNGFKEISHCTESDEYYTDIDSNFIKDRTCLRIRKRDNNVEVTFKGKSNTMFGSYCKLENNFKLDSSELDSFSTFLSSLGYYSYVVVEKERLTLNKIIDNLSYSIMIDKLPNIGGYVEFELLSNSKDYSKEELKKILSDFVNDFNSVKLKEVDEPYRDIVANNVYNSLVKKENVKDIYIDIDSVLCLFEKDFFNKYKDKMKELTGTCVKWGYYKKNTDDNFKKNIQILIKDYLDNFIVDDKELLVMLILLKKTRYSITFLTKTNIEFAEELFKKFNYKSNIIETDNGNIKQTLIKNNVCLNDIIYMKESDIRNINRKILVIINNENN